MTPSASGSVLSRVLVSVRSRRAASVRAASLALIGFASGAPIVASADSISLPVVADTYLRADIPTFAGGASVENTAGQLNTNAAFRVLLGFDLSTIPANATIASVNLSVYQSSQDSSGAFNAPISLNLHSTASFTEATATWTNTSNGAFTSTILSTSASLDGRENPVNLPKLVTFSSSASFVSLVQAAYDNRGTSSTMSLLIKDSDELSSLRQLIRLASKENSNASLIPTLNIVYTSSIPEPATAGSLVGLAALSVVFSAHKKRRSGM